MFKLTGRFDSGCPALTHQLIVTSRLEQHAFLVAAVADVVDVGLQELGASLTDEDVTNLAAAETAEAVAQATAPLKARWVLASLAWLACFVQL